MFSLLVDGLASRLWVTVVQEFPNTGFRGIGGLGKVHGLRGGFIARKGFMVFGFP